MKRETVERLLGFSLDAVEVRGPFVVIRAGETEPEEVVRADTLLEACQRMVMPLFDGELPDYDQEIIDEMPKLDEPLAVRATLYELSEDMGMERTRDARTLVYLAPVVERGMRLVVAWEAAPPRQDFALGIFCGGES